MVHDDREAGRPQIEHRADRDDVRVMQLGDEPRFAREPGLRFVIVDISRPNEFDRDLVTRCPLLGQIDERGAAAPNSRMIS